MNNLITNKYVLGEVGKADNTLLSCLDVIYGSDENYQFGAGVSAVSLLINNPTTFFRFHYFLDKVSSDFLEKLKVIASQFQVEFHVYELDNKLLKTLPASDVWSSAMYFRLVALDYLSSDYDFALYLDADVMCNGILDLTTNLIKDKVCGVVADDIGVRTKSETRLHAPSLAKTYFNSGVMFVNLKKWHEKQITQQCFELLSAENAKQRYKYPDQDVLNLILRDDLELLSQRFNTVYTLKNELYDSTHQKYQQVITPETVLIHYTGVSKPWHTWANYPASQPFYKALMQSPWTTNDLKPATKFVERKKEYKHLLKQGRFIKGFLSGSQYLFMKMFRSKRY
ncbi:TPA: lipopolysaccharide 1,2-glucosyltransferase [Providencia stuartii]|nr:lipopolysaccharide 1,2-glucosyltransferase [Providencia stuartii]HEM7164635.1 lipopolysaccharide 1,2-glucosyltransferase [Providencia stuartii]